MVHFNQLYNSPFLKKYFLYKPSLHGKRKENKVIDGHSRPFSDTDYSTIMHVMFMAFLTVHRMKLPSLPWILFIYLYLP